MFKPGSRKAQVYAHFKEHDASSALTFGVGLGLAVATLRSWLGSWSGARAPHLEITRPAESRRGVIVTWDPDAHVTLVDQGDEVSQIRWADGRTQFIGNDQLSKRGS